MRVRLQSNELRFDAADLGVSWVSFTAHMTAFDPGRGWLAAVLVWPLSVALAIGTVLFWYGRTPTHGHPPRGSA